MSLASSQGIRSRHKSGPRTAPRRHSPPSARPVSALAAEPYWAIRKFLLNLSFDFDRSMEEGSKSPSQDSGRWTLNSRHADSIRRNRERHPTTSSLESASSKSSEHSQQDQADSEGMDTVPEIPETPEEGSKVRRVSRVASFLRRSKKEKHKPEAETVSLPGRPEDLAKTHKSPLKGLFSKKGKDGRKLEAEAAVTEYQALGEEIRNMESGIRAGSRTSLLGIGKEKKFASTSSLVSSASKRMSLVKTLRKRIRGGKDKAGPGGHQALSEETSLAEGGSGSAPAIPDLVQLDSEPRVLRIAPRATRKWSPSPSPSPSAVLPNPEAETAQAEPNVEVTSPAEPNVEVTSPAEPNMEVTSPADPHAAILQSKILKELQEAKDRNSLEIKKQRRKKKAENRQRAESEPSPVLLRPPSVPILEKLQLELDGGNDTDTELVVEEAEPVLVLEDPLLDPRAELLAGLEDGEAEVDSNFEDGDAEDLTGFDPSRRRSSGSSFTDSFKHLEPFKFDHLEPIEEGKRERLYKVLVVGELGTGKTSIIKRYVHQFFSQHYRATIGVDFALKVLRWDPETVVRLQLWDIAGQERFGSMTRVYYKEAVGAFVVFDVTRGATLEAVPKWKADLDSKVVLPDGRPIPTVLLANKSDQPKEGLAANRDKMNDFCQQQGFSAWFETSAKDNINITESADFLVSKILEMDKWSQEPSSADPEKVDLGGSKGKGGIPSNCAC